MSATAEQVIAEFDVSFFVERPGNSDEQYFRQIGNDSAALLVTTLRAAGFAIVPVEPTEEMIAEGAIRSLITERHAKRVWEVMLSAAQGGTE